ncbi:unnamed protein product [Prorocentrum cordatum]|uniref:RAP domain-containing protein n=1 Tax=Prorocentrum cordatum TaxID=2364126 RepID=A0ABN9S4A8_9DINO|nr:unnamed protein product [Polarella glacialis]
MPARAPITKPGPQVQALAGAAQMAPPRTLLNQNFQVRNTFVYDACADAESPNHGLRRTSSEPAMPVAAAEQRGLPGPHFHSQRPTSRQSDKESDEESDEETPEEGTARRREHVRTEEQLHVLWRVECMKTTDGMLETALQHQRYLDAGTTAEVLHMAARKAHGVTPNRLLLPLLARLQQGIGGLRSGSDLSRLAWSLGKLCARAHPGSAAHPRGVEGCMLHICRQCPTVLAECSDLDLTNTLWSLARLYPGAGGDCAGGKPHVSSAAQAIVRACVGKAAVLTAQCLATSLWAMARLKVHGPDAREFVVRSVAQLRGAEQLQHFTTQGLANVLWGLAQLRVAGVCGGPADGAVQAALVSLAEASARRLRDFQPQELSMVAWSFAKLYESRQGDRQLRARGSRCSARPAKVDGMLSSLAEIATQCIDKFEDQGISNIAWALVVLDLAGSTSASSPEQAFLEAALRYCSVELRAYSTQAVANLTWACVRMDCSRVKTRERVSEFCSLVAEIMTSRMMGTTGEQHERHGMNRTVCWKDLSGVAAAFSHFRQRSRPVENYMTLLTHQTAEQVAKGKLTPQQMLNIAQSVARAKVPRSEMQTLVNNIEACIATRGLKLNKMDVCQWSEVQQWCPPRFDDQCRPPTTGQHRYQLHLAGRTSWGAGAARREMPAGTGFHMDACPAMSPNMVKAFDGWGTSHRTGSMPSPVAYPHPSNGMRAYPHTW